MGIPANKEQLQTAIRGNYHKLRKELAAISDELTSIKELEGHSKGTLMSIHDLVAYLTGWGELVLKWNRRKDAGEPVDFPETGYKWNELGTLAKKFYLDYEADSYPALLEKLDCTVNNILQLVDTKSNHELYEIEWYGKWTLGRMIQFNTASPYVNAGARIRKWKKTARH